MELDTFQSQALEVRVPDENFDPTKEPENGEEFLMRVIYERNKCPAIVVKKPPSAKDKNDQNSDKVELADIQLEEGVTDTAPICLRPSDPWKHIQLEEFSLLRNKIFKLRSKLAVNGYDIMENGVLFVEDSTKWLTFCQNCKPLLQTILRINQRTLEKLLEYEAEWLKGILESSEPETSSEVDMGNWLGEWIFSTLACLHLPLEPDTHSILRDIARSCVLLRNRLGPDDREKTLPLNLFLILISKFFNQLDLLKFV